MQELGWVGVGVGDGVLAEAVGAGEAGAAEVLQPAAQETVQGEMKGGIRVGNEKRSPTSMYLALMFLRFFLGFCLFFFFGWFPSFMASSLSLSERSCELSFGIRI